MLERLNRLDAPRPDDDTGAPVALPPIVEADPSYPPLPVPPATAGPAATAGVGGPGTTVGTTAGTTGDASTTGDAAATAATGTAGAVRGAAAGAGDAAASDGVAAMVAADGVAAALIEHAAGDGSPAPSGAPGAAPGVAADRTEVVPGVDTVPVEPTMLLDTGLPTEAMTAMTVTTDDSVGVVLPDRPLQRPVTFRRARPRVRRVTRVVRHVDTWSVFKVALVFNTILFVVCLTAGVLLWNVAYATGTIDNVEKFFEQFGWESFEFKGGEIYHNAWIGGLFVAIGLTGFAVLLATLFNLITDLVGGIRVSVLEEEVVARRPPHPSDLSLAGAPLLDPASEHGPEREHGAG